jgi:hypothetical protein
MTWSKFLTDGSDNKLDLEAVRASAEKVQQSSPSEAGFWENRRIL